MVSRKNILLAILIVLFLLPACSVEDEEPTKPVNIIDDSSNLYKIIYEDNLLKTYDYDDDGELYYENKKLEVDKVLKNSSNILMTYNGGYYKIKDEGYLEYKKGEINYKSKDKNYENIVGIITNPPKHSIMNVYDDSKRFINENKKVMVLFIDGFSWTQYEYAKENDYIPYMSKLNDFKKVLSVYKPVTNSGYAAMITGEPPYINGILNRDYREPKVDTIFDYMKNEDKEILLVEGNTNVISTGWEPVLNLDTNNNGYNDDEVFESSMENIENKDYVFIHFHGFDDEGHSYGPMAEETMEKIEEIDEYVHNLMRIWDGKVIITADHGMHKTEEGGNHGDFRYEDLIVPYGIFEGGK